MRGQTHADVVMRSMSAANHRRSVDLTGLAEHVGAKSRNITRYLNPSPSPIHRTGSDAPSIVICVSIRHALESHACRVRKSETSVQSAQSAGHTMGLCVADELRFAGAAEGA